MYRQYEKPRALEEELKALKIDYRKAVEENADAETLFSMYESIADLEERVNFAWQDDAE